MAPWTTRQLRPHDVCSADRSHASSTHQLAPKFDFRFRFRHFPLPVLLLLTKLRPTIHLTDLQQDVASVVSGLTFSGFFGSASTFGGFDFVACDFWPLRRVWVSRSHDGPSIGSYWYISIIISSSSSIELSGEVDWLAASKSGASLSLAAASAEENVAFCAVEIKRNYFQ